MGAVGPECLHAALLKVDDFEWDKVKPYLLYLLGFSLGVFGNMKALESSNVDTVIMFRSCTPIIVAVLEWAFMNRALPNRQSLLALLGVR